ncbi:MAG: hypothetical protein IPI77_16140 [Saprospiraceae bacterium]|nr:hypothetical protein [Saprospiraceae bacterium]
MVDMECYGGKINQVAPGYNAFIHRTAKMDFSATLFSMTRPRIKGKRDMAQCIYDIYAAIQ